MTIKSFMAAHPDGIDGHPVQLEALDDAGDVTKAVAVANQMVADKVTAVITASYNPAAVPQQLAIFNKAKLPALIQVGQDQYNDPSKWPYLFGVGSNDKLAGQALAAYIGKHPQYQKLAVLTDGSEAQVEIQNDLLTALKTSAPNASVVKSVSITPGSVDVSTAIAQLKAANPDFLLRQRRIRLRSHLAGDEDGQLEPEVLHLCQRLLRRVHGHGSAGRQRGDGDDQLLHAGSRAVPQGADRPDGRLRQGVRHHQRQLHPPHTSDNVPLELLKLAVEKTTRRSPTPSRRRSRAWARSSWVGSSTTTSARPTISARPALTAPTCAPSPTSPTAPTACRWWPPDHPALSARRRPHPRPPLLALRGGYQGMPAPPLGRRIWPVTKRAASDARYSTAHPMSSGLPIRPRGDMARIGVSVACRRASSMVPSELR